MPDPIILDGISVAEQQSLHSRADADESQTLFGGDKIQNNMKNGIFSMNIGIMLGNKIGFQKANKELEV